MEYHTGQLGCVSHFRVITGRLTSHGGVSEGPSTLVLMSHSLRLCL